MAINGTEYMRVDGYRDGYQGYVGIGTSVPAAKLDIIGNIKITDGTQGANKVLTSDANGLATWQTASMAGWSLLGNSGTTAGTNFLGTTDAVDLVIKTNNNEKMRIVSNGNVGIGTSSPTSKLELSGGLKVTGGQNTDKIITLTGGNNSATGLGGDINITGGPGYNMRGGNINIAAGYTSSWSGAGTSTDVFIKGGIMESTTSYAAIQVGGGKAAVGGTQETAGGDLTLLGGNANLGNRNGGKIILIPGTASGSGTPGNVGVGTTSPGQKLDVQGGNINTSGSLMTGSTARADATGNLINIGNITATGATTYASGAGTALTLQGGNSGSAMGGAVTIAAGTSGNNIAGANVSVNGGPGGYNGTGGAVSLTGGTGGQSGGSGAYITINGGGPNYGPGGTLILSSGLESPGNYWDPDHNGAVILAINGIEYMRVDGDRTGYQGYVGIGTTTPAYKLDVNGDINFTGNLYKSGLLYSFDGSETKVNAGTNINVTGTGTTGSPYVINATILEGTVSGQMQYWNGTAWVTVAAGLNGQILKYKNGVPTWTDGNINDLSIGDSYQGGIIAYFLVSGDPGYDANVRHGLIAAPSDQSAGAEWGCSGTAILATSTALGSGQANTTAIVAGCSTAGIAARICDDLVLGGYSDWYLPSKDELNLMYVNLKTQGLGGFYSHYYWSSSEFALEESAIAWHQRFGTGLQTGGYKYYTYYVRAIRAF